MCLVDHIYTQDNILTTSTGSLEDILSKRGDSETLSDSKS